MSQSELQSWFQTGTEPCLLTPGGFWDNKLERDTEEKKKPKACPAQTQEISCPELELDLCRTVEQEPSSRPYLKGYWLFLSVLKRPGGKGCSTGSQRHQRPMPPLTLLGGSHHTPRRGPRLHSRQEGNHHVLCLVLRSPLGLVLWSSPEANSLKRKVAFPHFNPLA